MKLNNLHFVSLCGMLENESGKFKQQQLQQQHGEQMPHIFRHIYSLSLNDASVRAAIANTKVGGAGTATKTHLIIEYFQDKSFPDLTRLELDYLDDFTIHDLEGPLTAMKELKVLSMRRCRRLFDQPSSERMVQLQTGEPTVADLIKRTEQVDIAEAQGENLGGFVLNNLMTERIEHLPEFINGNFRTFGALNRLVVIDLSRSKQKENPLVTSASAAAAAAAPAATSTSTTTTSAASAASA